MWNPWGAVVASFGAEGGDTHNLTTQSSNTHQTVSIRTNQQAQKLKDEQIGKVAMLIIAPLPEVVKPRNSRKSADFSKDADGKRPTPPQRTYEGL